MWGSLYSILPSLHCSVFLTQVLLHRRSDILSSHWLLYMVRVIDNIRSSFRVSFASGCELNADDLAAPGSDMINTLKIGSAGAIQTSEMLITWKEEIGRLTTGRNSRTGRELSALYVKVHTVVEDYETLLKGSVEMANSGIVLSEQMVNFVDYAKGPGRKEKDIKDKLSNLVTLAEKLSLDTLRLPSDYDQIEKHLSDLSDDIQTTHDSLTSSKRKRDSFNKLLKWLSIGIGCLIVAISIVALCLPPGGAVVVTGIVAAKLALGASLGGALVNLLNELREVGPFKTATQCKDAIEVLNRMRDEMPLARNCMAELKSFWDDHGDKLHEFATTSRRIKMDRSSAQMDKLTAVKKDWQTIGAAFIGYIDNTSKISPMRESVEAAVSAERVLL